MRGTPAVPARPRWGRTHDGRVGKNECLCLSLPHSTLDLHERGAKELMRSGCRRQVILLMTVSLLGEGTGEEGVYRRG